MGKSMQVEEIEKFSSHEIILINNIHKKAKQVFSFMENALFEREELVRLLILAIFTKEHIFMYGPPGTAKTNISNTLYLLANGTTFTKLMTDYTNYDDIFGKEIKQSNGMTKRVLQGKLPTAEFAFLDEIFKAGPEILNSLLTILNERLFDDDYNGRIEVPLRTALAASNEFPKTSYLKALFERFVFRITVPNIKNIKNRIRLFNEDFEQIKNLPVFSKNEVDLVRENFKLKNIKFNDDIAQKLSNLIDTLHQLLNPDSSDNKKNKIESYYEISGRTMYKMGAIMRLSAYLNKRLEVDLSDLLLTRYILWNDTFQREAILPKINNELFGGEKELHGDTSRQLEHICSFILRFNRNIKVVFRGVEKLRTEKDFIYFREETEIFLMDFIDTKHGLVKIFNILIECKEKEEIVKKNIFLHYESILDWKVDSSLIRVESQKFNELVKISENEFIDLKDKDKYQFKKLLERIFKLHDAISSEIKNWLDNNETFFDYKENFGV